MKVSTVTYPDVKRLETITGSSPQWHQFGTSVSDADLKVTVGILLLKDDTDSFFYVNQETTRSGGALLIVRQPPSTSVPFIPKLRCFLGVVPVGKGLSRLSKIGCNYKASYSQHCMYVRD